MTIRSAYWDNISVRVESNGPRRVEEEAKLLLLPHILFAVDIRLTTFLGILFYFRFYKHDETTTSYEGENDENAKTLWERRHERMG